MKKGVALIAVLGLMLAAALMATGVAYMISRYNQRSGLNLYSESAVAAARAGEASAKAWFTHEGQQAVNLLNAYFIQCATAAGCKPHKLDLVGKYAANASAHGQTFDIYLVDVLTDSTNSNKPVNVKLQINATGQDSSQSVATAIFELKGLSFQQAPPHYAYPDATVLVPDAMFVGGEAGLHVSNGGMTIDGNVYAEEKLLIDGGYGDTKLTVNGDLVVGEGALVRLDDTLVVNGNLYAAGLTTKDWDASAAVFVRDNAVFNRRIPWAQYMRIGGDAYFGKDVGIADAAGNGNGLADSLIVGGNATFTELVNIHTGKIVVNGDAGFTNASARLLGVHGTTSQLCVNGNAQIHATTYWASATAGIFNGDFVRTLQKADYSAAKPTTSPVVNSANKCQGFWNNSGTVPAALTGYVNTSSPTPAHNTATTWSGWEVSNSGWVSITPANQLQGIAASLTTSGIHKDAPFSLSASDVAHIADSLGVIWHSSNASKSLFPGDVPWKTACYKSYYNSVSTEALVCLEEEPLMPTYKGFTLIDFSQDVAYWSGVNATDPAVDGKFIFLASSNTAVTLPQTSSTGRILLFIRQDNQKIVNISVAGGGTCNCVIYSNANVVLTSGTINGALVVDYNGDGKCGADGANPYGNYCNTALQSGSHVVYDAKIINEAAVNTGLLKTPDGSTSMTDGYYVTSPRVLSLLAPRLDVGLKSEVWGPTNLDLASAAVKSFDRSLNLVPTMVSVLKKKYTNWSEFDAANPDWVRGMVYPDTLRPHCGALTRGTNDVDFSSPKTYLVPYSITCKGTTLTSNLVVWVKPDTVFASSSSIGASSSSSSIPVVVSSSSTDLEVSSSSETSNVGLVFKFMYHGLSSASCFGATTASIPLDFSLYNGSIYPVNLADFRFSYFIGSSSPTTWSYTAPSKLQDMVGAVTVVYDTVSRTFNYDAGYNLRAVVSFESSTIASKSAASFENLVLKSINPSNAIGDYSYKYWNRCPDALEANSYIVVERKEGEVWTAIRGTAPSAWTGAGTMTEQ